MALMASGVAIPDDLKAALGGYTKKAQGNIGGIYKNLGGNFASDQATLGHTPSGPGNSPDYTLGEGEAASSRGANDALYSALGGTAYKDTLNQREYNQNTELANEVGALNRPSTLEEALTGLGAGSRLAGTGYGLFKKFKPNVPQGTPNGTDLGSSLSLFDPNASGYGRYMSRANAGY